MYWSGWLSKSQIIQYLMCPYSWYVGKIRRIKPAKVKAFEDGRNVHQTLEELYNNNETFENEEHVLQELKKMEHYETYKEQFANFSKMIPRFSMRKPNFREIRIIDKEYKMNCVIDRVDRVDNKLHVVEYKWSNKWPWCDFELALYGALLERHWGNPINKGAIFYLSDEELRYVDITPKMKNDAMNTINTVRNDIKGKLRYDKVKEGQFQKKQGIACENCPYKHYCGLS